MKKINKIILGSLLILIGILSYSCIDDIGNYDYEDVDQLFPVKVKDLESGYEVLQADTLEIHPEFETIDDESRYQYQWYVISPGSGSLPEKTILGNTKDLKARVQLDAGTYTLFFQITDPKLSVYTYVKSSLSVTQSVITGGWYVLKDINDETDFDYINLEGKIIRDVLRNISVNSQVPGKARKILYQPTRYYHQQVQADGTVKLLSNQKALHLLTDKEYRTFNAANWKLFKNYKEQFYEFLGPTPTDIALESLYGLYLINAGKMHTIYGMSANVGKYGMPKTIGTSSEYDLYDKMVAGTYGNALVFDKISKTFFYTTSSGTTLNNFNEEGEAVSLKNMKLNVLDLLVRAPGMNSTAFALVENQEGRDKGIYSLLSLTVNYSPATKYPITNIDTIPNKYKMPLADVRSAPLVSSCIYFSSDNNLNIYETVGDSRESVLKTFPADEKISYIQNISGKIVGDQAIVNYLVVTTNSTAGWKLYFFKIIGVTPQIDPEPVHVFEGTGNARYVMYRPS